MHLTRKLEMAEQDDRIGDIADIEWLLNMLGKQTVLGHRKDGKNGLLIQITGELVKMHAE